MNKIVNHLGSILLIAQSVFGNTSKSGILENLVWIQAESHSISGHGSIEWTGKYFVTIGQEAQILVSQNGIDWETINEGNRPELVKMVFANNKLVAVGARGLVMTSEDGRNWTSGVIHESYYFDAISFGNGNYLASGCIDGFRCVVAVSPDGEKWEVHPIGALNFHSIIWAGDKFMAVGAAPGYRIFYSFNGIDWYGIEDEYTKLTLMGIAWSGTSYVAIGALGTVLNSKDGKNWTKIDIETEEFFQSLKWNGEYFIGTGLDGLVVASKDGEVWEKKLNDVAITWLQDITWNDSRYVAVGTGGYILYADHGPFQPSLLKARGNRAKTDFGFKEVGFGNINNGHSSFDIRGKTLTKRLWHR